MKHFFYLAVLAALFLFQACGIDYSKSTTPVLQDSTTVRVYNPEDSAIAAAEAERRAKVFAAILDSTVRQNKELLFKKLIAAYPLKDIDQALLKKCHSQKILGCPDSVWVVELDLENKSSCLPNGQSYLFIFSKKGQLIFEDRLAELQWLALQEGQAPVLFCQQVDCKGTGYQQVYKFESESIVNIFDVLFDTTPAVFDQDPSDGAIYQPAALKMTQEDRNKDGLKDLVFVGKKLLLKDAVGKEYSAQQPYKTEAVEYVFYYQKAEDWLVMKRVKQ